MNTENQKTETLGMIKTSISEVIKNLPAEKAEAYKNITGAVGDLFQGLGILDPEINKAVKEAFNESAHAVPTEFAEKDAELEYHIDRFKKLLKEQGRQHILAIEGLDKSGATFTIYADRNFMMNTLFSLSKQSLK